MGICWYCHWGWPKQVADIYLRAVRDLNGYDDALLYSGAHVVWADENFELAQKCLDDYQHNEDYEDWQEEVVKRSLRELVALPENVHDMWPDDYDDEHPELYPPPDGAEMVRVEHEADKIYKELHGEIWKPY